MSRPSDLGTIVWSADQPHSRLAVNLEAIQGITFHYYRLIRVTITGKDPLK